MQGVFITGTDTGVGKTYIAVKIASQLNRRNIKVIPRKPVESGCTRRDDQLMPQDAIALKQAASYSGELSEVCPYPFEHPTSPVRAAHLVNVAITTEQLVNACRQGCNDGMTLVEGAGGFYSPLAKDGLNADLAAALQLPVILVADDRLGTINQVLLSAEAIQKRGLSLLAIVLNTLDDTQKEQIDNFADLRERLECPIFSIPYAREGDVELPEALIELLITHTNSKFKNNSVHRCKSLNN